MDKRKLMDKAINEFIAALNQDDCAFFGIPPEDDSSRDKLYEVLNNFVTSVNKEYFDEVIENGPREFKRKTSQEQYREQYLQSPVEPFQNLGLICNKCNKPANYNYAKSGAFCGRYIGKSLTGKANVFCEGILKEVNKSHEL